MKNSFIIAGNYFNLGGAIAQLNETKNWMTEDGKRIKNLKKMIKFYLKKRKYKKPMKNGIKSTLIRKKKENQAGLGQMMKFIDLLYYYKIEF